MLINNQSSSLNDLTVEESMELEGGLVLEIIGVGIAGYMLLREVVREKAKADAYADLKKLAY